RIHAWRLPGKAPARNAATRAAAWSCAKGVQREGGGIRGDGRAQGLSTSRPSRQASRSSSQATASRSFPGLSRLRFRRSAAQLCSTPGGRRGRIMARWLRDRLLFRSAKPAPPQPDYTPGPDQPDLLAAYRLQRELDFEDPYTGGAAPPQHRGPPLPIAQAPSDQGGGGRGGGDGTGRPPDQRLPRPAGKGLVVPLPSMGPLANWLCSSHCQMLILEDYANPFDTRQEGSGRTREQERVKSEGYMEPYEAQKLLEEIQRKSCKEGLPIQKPLHLYDIPYDAAEDGTDTVIQHLPGIQCRYSWLPEDDERPPEEYDQPWEWKKERISRVFAVEIEGIQELPWPPPVGQLDSTASHLDAEGPPTLQSISARCLSTDTPPSLPNVSTSPPDSRALSSPLDVAGQGGGKIPLPSCMEKRSSTCWLSMEPELVFGERVNPSLPLESQAWYHGALSRVAAEGLLRLCREASYLVRNSESSHDAFSLSLKSSQGFLHMKLLQTEDKKFILGQHSPPFDNVPEIIHHYASHKLPIQGAEHMSLLYPVTTQPSNCLAAEQ
ncbi:hypothetical protein lerEdw1_008264, partial [Lerista edwardsae]